MKEVYKRIVEFEDANWLQNKIREEIGKKVYFDAIKILEEIKGNHFYFCNIYVTNRGKNVNKDALAFVPIGFYFDENEKVSKVVLAAECYDHGYDTGIWLRKTNIFKELKFLCSMFKGTEEEVIKDYLYLLLCHEVKHMHQVKINFHKGWTKEEICNSDADEKDANAFMKQMAEKLGRKQVLLADYIELATVDAIEARKALYKAQDVYCNCNNECNHEEHWDYLMSQAVKVSQTAKRKAAYEEHWDYLMSNVK